MLANFSRVSVSSRSGVDVYKRQAQYRAHGLYSQGRTLGSPQGDDAVVVGLSGYMQKSICVALYDGSGEPLNC